MECVVYKRRIVLGGIASAAILASGVITAGTALAATTPQLPVAPAVTASSLIPGSPMSQVPGMPGALQAAPAVGSLTGGAAPVSGAMPMFNNVTGAIPGVSGVTGAAQGLQPASLAQRGLSNVTTRGSVIGQRVTGVTGNTAPATVSIPSLGNATGTASIPSLGNATGGVSKMTGSPGSATSEISSLADLIGVAPDLSPVAGMLGGGF
jgi:hypothetical protein